VDRVQISATICVDERHRDRHLAAQGGIGGLELVHFDDLRVRHEFHETAAVGVGAGRCLAGAGRLLIGQRYPDCAAFTGLERMHLAGHAVRHLPPCDRTRIKQRPIDGPARRADVAADAGCGHAILRDLRQVPPGPKTACIMQSVVALTTSFKSQPVFA
jgi:hypothetical protein